MPHPGRQLVEDVASSLRTLMAGETAVFAGAWLPVSRRTYVSPAQHGTGAGPFKEVIDYRWDGAFSSSAPIAGIAFALEPAFTYWVKSSPPSLELPVSIRVAAYADGSDDRCTVTLGLGGSFLPGFPAPATPGLPALALGAGTHPLGTALSIVQAPSVELCVVLVPGSLVEMGRNRLWRLRDRQAPHVPEPIRTLLTRRRSGRIATAPDGSSG
jgi:hypothetical protein